MKRFVLGVDVCLDRGDVLALHADGKLYPVRKRVRMKKRKASDGPPLTPETLARAEKRFAELTRKAFAEQAAKPAPWVEMLKARGGRRKS